MTRAPGASSAADLEPLVAAAAAQCLRLPAESVGLDVPFARLGLDSLGCVELAAALETALSFPVPADALVECATVRSLCAALGGGAAADVFDRMRADAVLAADIQPRPFTGVESLADAEHVLLTGATGFLGTALLAVLLTRTRARVTCLARTARAPVDGERVELVHGDLTQPFAGLSADVWARLAARTDAVCHAGASINWIAGYDALRDVNVLGTREMLRFAADAGASFHYVSSVSVCYSTDGPRAADEDHNPLGTIEGLHFGYAESKAVAESLVRQAGARGLRTRIYRPALLAGDSRSGAFNRDDILSRLIAGCVRMGAAPDLDWRLDALPVDNAAAAIVALSGAPAGAACTWHLAHPGARHWRECVLWMRLYGYDVRLVPYREWTRRLRQAAADPGHPLRPLQSFFLDEHAGGLAIPELHEQSRATTLESRRTAAAISRARVPIAPLDADLMDRYFSAFVAAGTLPAPRRSRPRRQGGVEAAALAREMTGASPQDIDVQPFPSGHGIMSELAAWESGGACGLFSVRLAGAAPLVLKIGAHADDVRTVGEALARICDARLAEAYEEYGQGLGTASGHEREVALYRDQDPVLRAHTPAVVATHANPATRAWAVLIEDLRGATLLDAADEPGAWRDQYVDAVVDGIAAIHGAWHGRVRELRRARWLAPVRTTTVAHTMTPLWRALADHAAPLFAAWTDASLPRRQQALIDRLADWRPALDAAPQTLIHNDFNPRNVCLRPAGDGWRLCAFDWELATVGAPVRDLAEFLCFVAPVDVGPARLCDLLERHAAGFAAAAGVAVDRAAWALAFRAALAELLLDRLSVYAMVHRVRPQRFLPRVLRTWSLLHSLFPVHGLAG